MGNWSTHKVRNIIQNSCFLFKKLNQCEWPYIKTIYRNLYYRVDCQITFDIQSIVAAFLAFTFAVEKYEIESWKKRPSENSLKKK